MCLFTLRHIITNVKQLVACCRLQPARYFTKALCTRHRSHTLILKSLRRIFSFRILSLSSFFAWIRFCCSAKRAEMFLSRAIIASSSRSSSLSSSPLFFRNAKATCHSMDFKNSSQPSPAWDCPDSAGRGEPWPLQGKFTVGMQLPPDPKQQHGEGKQMLRPMRNVAHISCQVILAALYQQLKLEDWERKEAWGLDTSSLCTVFPSIKRLICCYVHKLYRNH